MPDTDYSWESERIRTTLAQLEKTRIPTVAKQFMMEVGLPTRVVLFCDHWFDISFWGALYYEIENMATAFRWPDGEVPKEATRQWIIGHSDFDGGQQCTLCIEEDTGNVIDIDEDGEVRFWNSSVEKFSESLSAFESAFDSFRIRPTEYDYSKHADVFVNKLLEIDPSTLQDKSGWTGVIHTCHNQKF